MRNIEEILKLVCGFLNEEGAVYVVVGGLTVLFYGVPRTTMDIGLRGVFDDEKARGKKNAGGCLINHKINTENCFK